jgi:serine/threonine protein kinase
MDVPHIIAGRFRIECEIGKGGMGTVYRATHLGLERPVAVKIIKQEFAFDRDVADRFMREARTMARLRHTHAAMIFDAGNLPDGRHFIVMEYVEGETLSEALAREGPFSPKRAVRIASDICEVLSEAHGLGIIHRDLKPSNIMLNERGVCVLDFGVAKVLATSADATATHATTGSGMVIGTPRYMSPEQCLGHRIEARSDLYSLGVLLYEMLAGYPPFTDPLASAVLVKQATAPPEPLTSIRPDIPPPLAQTVHMLLAKRPDQRPINAHEARVFLEKSIAARARRQLDTQPFAGTMATLNPASRPTIFRAVTPIAMLVLVGLLLLVWDGGSSWVSSTPDAPVEAAAITPKEAKIASATPLKSVPRALPAIAAEPVSRTADPLSRTPDPVPYMPLDETLVIHGPKGDQIVTVNDDKRTGASSLSVMERHGKTFNLVHQAPLDMADFHAQHWTVEELDVDGDGYDEVICKGAGEADDPASIRLLMYAPRSRALYALRIQRKREGETRLVTFSPSLRAPSAKFIRGIMLDRARAAALAQQLAGQPDKQKGREL